MSYVIYHKETTVLLDTGKSAYNNSFETEAAAKAALTRAVKKAIRKGKDPINKDDYVIADSKTFHETIEKKETRRGVAMAHGKEFVVGVNTPWTSGPWSETYWSS